MPYIYRRNEEGRFIEIYESDNEFEAGEDARIVGSIRSEDGNSRTLYDNGHWVERVAPALRGHPPVIDDNRPEPLISESDLNWAYRPHRGESITASPWAEIAQHDPFLKNIIKKEKDKICHICNKNLRIKYKQTKSNVRLCMNCYDIYIMMKREVEHSKKSIIMPIWSIILGENHES